MIPLDHPLVRAAFAWASADVPPEASSDDYCQTRDALDARLSSMITTLTRKGVEEKDALLIHALLSEIGGNAFDHNIGQWSDLPGVLFVRSFTDTPFFIVSDRGQGLRTTLLNIKPSLKSDADALQTAFLEHISSRAPERRGNGLKFVREEIRNDGVDLFFQSGDATYTVIDKAESWQSSRTRIPGCAAVLSFSQ